MDTLKNKQKNFANNPNSVTKKELITELGIYLDTQIRKILDEKDIPNKCILLKHLGADLDFTLFVLKSERK